MADILSKDLGKDAHELLRKEEGLNIETDFGSATKLWRRDQIWSSIVSLFNFKILITK